MTKHSGPTYILTPRQSRAYELLTNPEDLALMFGGGKGGGKTFFFCVWVDNWCKYLKELFGLVPDRHKPPLPVGFIGRKVGVDFNRTTLETFKRVIPSGRYRIREQAQEIIFFDCLKVFYGGLDDTERINKFNSAEFAFFGLDQAEETERTDVDVLQATLRLKYNGIQPPYKELYTSNPADCWLKEDFIDNKLPHKYFIPALHSDNPHLPDGYALRLESTFKYNSALLAAYLHGDWYSLQAFNTLISSKMIQELRGIAIYPKDLRRVIVCDPSLGGDECVIYAMENGVVKEMKIMHERDTMKIAGEMGVMGERHKTPNYALDVIGIGQGIYDRLRELKPKSKIIGINSAAEAQDKERFDNLRAEIAWRVMTKIQDKEVPYPEDEMLRTQLSAYRFKVLNSNGKIQLEPKAETKKRIGQSPDRGDAWLMGIWALDEVQSIKKTDAWQDLDEGSEIASGVESAMTA